MDYKFVLLVVLILALIYIITTGFNNIRIQLSNMRDIILDRIKLNSEDVKIKVDNNIGRCIKEIGESNINFVEQIRKIDNITGQKITNGTENYNTETESNKKGDEKFSYFMSDVSHNNRVVSDKDNFKVNLGGNTEAEPKETSSSSSSKSQQSNNKKINSSSESSSNSSKSSSKSSSESASHHSNNSGADSVSHHSNNSGADSVSHHSNQSGSNKNSQQNKESNIEIENSSSSSGTTIDFENITVGTAASGKRGQKPPITLNSKYDANVVVDVKNLTSSNFAKMESYKIEDLKGIARAFTIPTTVLDNITKQRRQLKKEELYNKIKDLLINKKKSK